MSNARSPREVCSTTIGMSGLMSPSTWLLKSSENVPGPLRRDSSNGLFPARRGELRRARAQSLQPIRSAISAAIRRAQAMIVIIGLTLSDVGKIEASTT